MTPVDIDKLKERLSRAMLPWRQEAFNEVIAGEPDYASFILSGDGESILAQQISDPTAALIVDAVNSLPALIAKAERVDALDWLSGQTRLELHHYSPVYGDDDDQAIEWRVTEVSGPINDREWTTVGRGETAFDAILSARNALSPKPEISDPTKRMEKILGAKFTRKATP